jgi:hypothetical protein
LARDHLHSAVPAATDGRQRSGQLFQRGLQPAVRPAAGAPLGRDLSERRDEQRLCRAGGSLPWGLLYRSSSSYSEPIRTELQALQRDYALYIIHKHWPAHEHGQIFQSGAGRLGVIRETLMSYVPTTKTQEILQDQTLSIFNELVRARVERLGGVGLTIPGVFWYVVLIGAAINVVLIWMLDMRFFAHLVLGGLVSFFLGVMIFLIAAMDQPLRGAVAIDSGAYRLIYDTLMASDEIV